jgi:hypothetical protein
MKRREQAPEQPGGFAAGLSVELRTRWTLGRQHPRWRLVRGRNCARAQRGLPRPGGNRCYQIFMPTILKEVAPACCRVDLMWNGTTLGRDSVGRLRPAPICPLGDPGRVRRSGSVIQLAKQQADAASPRSAEARPITVLTFHKSINARVI